MVNCILIVFFMYWSPVYTSVFHDEFVNRFFSLNKAFIIIFIILTDKFILVVLFKVP